MRGPLSEVTSEQCTKSFSWVTSSQSEWKSWLPLGGPATYGERSTVTPARSGTIPRWAAAVATTAGSNASRASGLLGRQDVEPEVEEVGLVVPRTGLQRVGIRPPGRGPDRPPRRGPTARPGAPPRIRLPGPRAPAGAEDRRPPDGATPPRGDATPPTTERTAASGGRRRPPRRSPIGPVRGDGRRSRARPHRCPVLALKCSPSRRIRRTVPASP